MNSDTVRTEKDIEETVDTYADSIYRLCFLMLKNKPDAEDAVQDVIIRYIESKKQFESEEHKKAWLLTVANNRCRDMLRLRIRHRNEELPELAAYTQSEEDTGILSALMSLPEKYRAVLILYYVEQYKVREIAGMLGKGESAIKMRLKKGRELLAEIYRKEYL